MLWSKCSLENEARLIVPILQTRNPLLLLLRLMKAQIPSTSSTGSYEDGTSNYLGVWNEVRRASWHTQYLDIRLLARIKEGFPDDSGKCIYRKTAALERLSRYTAIFSALVLFALFNTMLLGFEIAGYHPWPQTNTNSGNSYGPSSNPSNSVIAMLQGGSYVLAPTSWGFVLGAWLWRGRVKSQWTRLGLTEDLFRLLIKMRGSGTRTSIMAALQTPKDRFQISKDLGLDWTTVDYQMRVLLKYGLVNDETAYGNVRLYKLTPIAEVLLKALQEMERNEGSLRSGPVPDTTYGP